MPVFNQTLITLATEYNSPIPPFLEKCFQFILEKHADLEGIFRIPGNDRELKRIERSLDLIGDITIDERTDPYNICNIITRFLRQIPDHVLLDGNSVKWFNANTVDDLSKLVQELPILNRALLSRLLGFFLVILQHTSKNRMTSKSIAIILSPNLICDPDNPASLFPVENILLLLQEYSTIFESISALDKDGNFLSEEAFSAVVNYVPEFFFQTKNISSQFTKPDKPDKPKKKKETISRQYLDINRIEPDVLLAELLSYSYSESYSSLSPI